MIQWLLAKEEGPNTFWGKTVFKGTAESVKKRHPIPTYRDGPTGVEILLGSEEGPNTFWNDFDPRFTDIASMRFFDPPADDRAVLRVLTD